MGWQRRTCSGDPWVQRAGLDADAVGGRMEQLRAADTFWLSTVHPDGRPHAAPLITDWHTEALWFATGPDETHRHRCTASQWAIIWQA